MIYTFYSYKGGVGRSMALANVAEWFYLQGLRVVIIDWDLEAPGLENFFYSADKDLELIRSQLGLIDLLMAYKRLFPRLSLPSLRDAGPRDAKAVSEDVAQSAAKVLQESLPPISDVLFPIHPADTSESGNSGALWLLPAGWRSGDRFPLYAEAVQSFDWTDFYASFAGEFYFEWMRSQLLKPELADLVLIDSRTGVTEMGGVCTRQLADVVVSVCAPNVQNLAGIVAMAKSFGRDELVQKRGQARSCGAEESSQNCGPGIEMVVVPARIDLSELDARNYFEQQFRLLLDDLTPDAFKSVQSTFWDLAIQYVPKYAYAEKLAIGATDTAKELVEAYKEIAAHLVLLARGETAIRIRKQFAAELQRVFKNRLPSLLISYAATDGAALAGKLRHHLEEYNLPLLPDFAEAKDRGDSWGQITGSLDQAKHLLIVLTPDSVSSRSMPKQWRYARQQGVCVFLVKEQNAGDEMNLDQLPRWMRNTPFYDLDQELPALLRQLQNPPQPSRIPFMCPDPPEIFVDRADELRQMKDHLLGGEPEDQGPVSVALWGPPGAGKTALAKVFCHDEDVISAYVDGILWVTLGATPNITGEVGKLYTALTGDIRNFATEEEAVTSLAEKLGDRHCLIVINDVWNSSHLQPFLSGGRRCARLITTGDLSIVTRMGAKTVSVGDMSTADAIRMIAPQASLSPDELHAFEEFVERLGKSPLALRLARAALQNRIEQGNPPLKALRHLQRAFDKHGVIAFDQSDATDRDQSVARSIAFSLEQLDPELRERYVQLVFFPPDADIALADVSKLWELSEFEAEDQVQSLGSLSLLKYDPETKTITLNHVIQSYILNHIPDQAGLNSKIEAAFSHLSPKEQEEARRICTRLVRLARVEEVGEDTRLRISVDDFDPAVRPLIAKLADTQIVAVRKDKSTAEETVELVDDSVIESWDRLRTWIANDRDFLVWRQQLQTAIAYWEESKHSKDRLLSGLALSLALDWQRERRADLDETENLYLEKSERFRRKRRSSMAALATATAAVVIILLILVKLQTDERAEATALKTSVEHIKAGNDLMSKRKFDEAVTEFREAVASKKDYADAYYNLGLAYFQKRDIDDAISSYDQAIALRPNYGEALLHRGRAYRNRGDADGLDKAFTDYDKAIALLDQSQPSDDKSELAMAYNFRCYAYYKRGDIGNAFKDCRQAIVLDPKYADAYDSLGSLYLATNDFSTAIDQFKQAIKLDPSYIVAYANLGKAYFLQKENDRALAQLSDALDLFENLDQKTQRRDTYLEALYYRGRAYANKGDQQKAIDDFSEVIALNDGYVDAYHYRGMAYEAIGAKERAVADFKRVQSLSNNQTQIDWANQRLEQLNKQPIVPRIYVRYSDPSDFLRMDQMSQNISQTLGYKVRAEVRPNTNFQEVRFFYPEDKDSAERIRQAYMLLLSDTKVNLKLKDRSNTSNNIARGTIEVWLPSLSGDKEGANSSSVPQAKKPAAKRAAKKK
jgi:tetratricopeptide (TPR) repeat protein